MKKPFLNLIGPQIRGLRVKREMTQEALATQLQVIGAAGLDRGKIAKIECRLRSVFDYELFAIAHVLGVSPGYFVPEDEALFTQLPALSAWRETGN